MSNDTRQVALDFIQKIEARHFLDAFSKLAADGIYIVIGKTPASRVYHGRQDVFDNLVPVLSTFIEAPVLKFQDPIVDGDRVVMLASGKGVGPTGPYDQPYYAFSAKVRGNEFSEITEFMDTAMLETAVFGKKLVDA